MDNAEEVEDARSIEREVDEGVAVAVISEDGGVCERRVGVGPLYIVGNYTRNRFIK